MNTKTKLVHVLHALLHMYVPKYTLLAVKNINSSTSAGMCIMVSLKLIRIQLQLTLINFKQILLAGKKLINGHSGNIYKVS